MRRWLLQMLTFFPTRSVERTPEAVGLAFQDVAPLTADGPHLHGWWIAAKGPGPSLGSILYCHGNAYNVGTRVEKARLLVEAGFDVLVFDYRGYGRSEGSPSEEGTYLDARAARAALLSLPGVD